MLKILHFNLEWFQPQRNSLLCRLRLTKVNLILMLLILGFIEQF